MHNFWPRVAQVRSVGNSPSCVSATNALARRTTTVTARRTPRVGNAFTLFSSSLAVTAAVVDSKRKESRSRQWERVISKARAQVEETENQQESRLASLSRIAEAEELREESTEGSDESFYEPMTKIVGQLPPSPSVTWPDHGNHTWGEIFEWAAEQRQARISSGFQYMRGLPLSLLQDLSADELDELVKDEKTTRRFYGGPDCSALVEENPPNVPLSRKKLLILEWSFARLVWLLLLHCSENHREKSGSPLIRQQKYNAAHPELLNKAECVEELRSDVFSLLHASDPRHDVPQQSHQDQTSICKFALKDTQIYSLFLHADEQVGRWLELARKDKTVFDDFESPQLPMYDPTLEGRNASALNQTLQSLLLGMNSKKDFTPLLLKICYNLLSSASPPNIHTCNLLLVHFAQIKKTTIVHALDRIIRQCHLRPNEITHTTLLRFFTASEDKKKFLQYVRRIEGFVGGMHNLAPNEKTSSISMHRFRAIGVNSKLVEKARMNSRVYDALIVGLLEFSEVQSAMCWYCVMISEGWETSAQILTAILRYCCLKADFDAGLTAWRQFSTITDRAGTAAYDWMLRLCRDCQQWGHFYHLLREGAAEGRLSSSMLKLHDRSTRLTECISVDTAGKIIHFDLVKEKNGKKKAQTSTKKWTSDRTETKVQKAPIQKPNTRTQLAASIRLVRPTLAQSNSLAQRNTALTRDDRLILIKHHTMRIRSRLDKIKKRCLTLQSVYTDSSEVDLFEGDYKYTLREKQMGAITAEARRLDCLLKELKTELELHHLRDTAHDDGLQERQEADAPFNMDAEFKIPDHNEETLRREADIVADGEWLSELDGNDFAKRLQSGRHDSNHACTKKYQPQANLALAAVHPVHTRLQALEAWKEVAKPITASA